MKLHSVARTGRRPVFSGILFTALLIISGLPLTGLAIKTQTWSLDSSDEFAEGKLDQVIVSSRGDMQPGWSTEEIKIEAEGVWDMLKDRDGTLWLATGNQGRLMALSNGKLSEQFKAEAVSITSLARDAKGNLYFATMPGGSVYRRTSKGSISLLAELPAEYVWTLAAHPKGGIIAGTGTEGKVFRVLENGKVELLAETGDQHVVCLAVAGDGTIYGGTSNKGTIFSISTRGKLSMVYDFEQEEVKKIALVSGNGNTVQIIAAVNSQTLRFARESQRPPIKEEDKEEGEENEGEDDEPTAMPSQRDVYAPVRGGQGRISGIVYSVGPLTGARTLVSIKGSAVTDMLLTEAGDIYVATDQGGKIYRAHIDSTEYDVLFDFEASQVLSMEINKSDLEWIGLGMPGGIHKVKSHKAGQAVYTSKVFDANFPSSWGKASWRASGLIKMDTRSGNVPEPDQSWSKWKAAGTKSPASIASPSARYLQLRIKWPLMSDAVVHALTIPYTIANQPHYIDYVEVAGQAENGKKDSNGRSRSTARPTRTSSRSKAASTTNNNSKKSLKWQVTNPDSDALIFRLYFQPESAKQWIPIHSPQDITKTNFDWNTESIADGYYRIKVQGSDQRANPPGTGILHEKLSEPFLVDNRRPEVKSLKVGSAGKVNGKVTDSLSNIANLEYCVDGGQWFFILPKDGNLDETTEDIEFTLPGPYTPGLHMLSVRGSDDSGNIGVGQAEFTWKTQ